MTGSRVADDRITTPLRPPKYIPVYNHKGKTTPSITPNGLQGEKTFIKFSNAMHGEVDYLDQNGLLSANNRNLDISDLHQQPEHSLNAIPSPSKIFNASRATTSVQNGSQKPPPTPLKIEKLQNHMTLIGKASPVADSVVKCSSPFIKSSAPASRAQKHPPPQPEQGEEETISGPSRLAVNIPVADMVSASSAAVNSIADFQEFGMDGAERCADVTDSHEISL